MNINTSDITDQADKSLTRADVEKLLQIAGSSDKLNLSKQNLTRIDLKNIVTTQVAKAWSKRPKRCKVGV